MKKCILFIIIFVFFTSIGLSANLGSLFLGEFDVKSRSERIAIANDLIRIISGLNEYIPNIKPNEKKWLTRENAEIDKIKNHEVMMERLLQLRFTPEFAQNRIKILLMNLLKILNLITTTTNIKDEMLNWAKVSSIITDREILDESLVILVDSERIKFSKSARLSLALGNENTRYDLIYDSLGKGIQHYIVIPYLAGKVNK